MTRGISSTTGARVLRLVPEGASNGWSPEREPGASAERHVRLRLTARGRRALRCAQIGALVLLAGVVGAVLAFGTGAQAAAGSGELDDERDTFAYVVVEEGQSLWSIAAEVSDGADVRDVMVDIAEVNGLASPVVHPGQELAVPTR